MITDLISHADIRMSYRFEELLGEGAFSQVKKAIYLQQEKPVAIKIIDKKNINSKDLQLYLNQCEIMFKLDHPNIIQIYEVYDNQDYFYIVMEYMEGGQLCDNKNLHRIQNEAQICEIVKTITDTLDFCHSNNIVHRDIKPENILWSTKQGDAVLKIADFGYAKMVGQSLMTTACGTPMFFSPEILSRKPYNQSVDYWSLGVITYILLSGKAPFDDENQNQLYQKIMAAKVQFPQKEWIYVSCAAKDFILRILQKNPSKRYNAQKIREHPWITSDHNKQLLYKARSDNIRMFTTRRRVNKTQYLIDQTILELEDSQI